MPRAEPSAPAAGSLASATSPAAAVAYAPTTVRGWAGGEAVQAMVFRPRNTDEMRAAIDSARECARSGDPGAGAIARGMGRSYGDAAQLAGGLLLDMTALRSLTVDAERASVTASAGATIGDLLERLVPLGWMPPVVPGTQHVTVGGAIASDVHGKNHGVAGTFGNHVQALGLLASSGDVLELGPARDPDLFAATLGGMGLTGVVLWARIALERIDGPLLTVDTNRVGSLDDALAELAAPGGDHRVAWLDLLSRRPARGIVTRARHVIGASARSGAAGHRVTARATVPVRWPAGLLRPQTVRAFNELRYRRSRTESGRVSPLGTHMFPLDSLGAWPRLYGPAGFVQYQLAVPRGREQVLEIAIERLRRARVPCYLATLKDLGCASHAPLSFPISGWTLALDLPRAAPEIGVALRDLDQIVAAAGGRVYLTKDARLTPEVVRAMYPRLEEWRTVRDRADPDCVWRSDLALRTGLIRARQ